MNPTVTHPGQPQMQAQVILASKTNTGAPPIYTVRMKYPRFIHSEFMTHRVFGRNARSSRAVPVKRMIEEVRTNPVVPWHWGKNQPGMQAGEELTGIARTVSEDMWKEALGHAVTFAEEIAAQGAHKQIVNRLLEPFMWIDVLATATDWSNFLWLRDHEDAEPHIRDLAVLVKQAMDAAEIEQLEPGDWHLPYIDWDDEDYAQNEHGNSMLGFKTEAEKRLLCQISAARCARISYTPFDSDKADIGADLRLFDKLMGSDRVHASPLEHQATPDTINDDAHPDVEWENPHLHGNLTGWIQFRKTIPGENYTGQE